MDSSGELGIRTPGPVTVNSFQDCRNRPLCQLSAAKIRFELNQQKKTKNVFSLFQVNPIQIRVYGLYNLFLIGIKRKYAGHICPAYSIVSFSPWKLNA